LQEALNIISDKENVDYLRYIRRTVVSQSEFLEGNMKYMLLIYHDEQAFLTLSEEEKQALYGQYRKFREELVSTSNYLDGSQLRPSSSANSVRVRNGRSLTTDGPFAETKEQLGGYFLIEAASQEEANAIAARIPSAQTGTIEVRALA
jgi:hypothetical protein